MKDRIRCAASCESGQEDAIRNFFLGRVHGCTRESSGKADISQSIGRGCHIFGRGSLDRFVESRQISSLSDRICGVRIRTAGLAVLGLAVLVAITFLANATEAPEKNVEGSHTPTADGEARAPSAADPGALPIGTVPFDGTDDRNSSRSGREDTHSTTQATIESSTRSTVFKGRITDAGGERRPITFWLHQTVDRSEAQAAGWTRDSESTRTVTTSVDGTFEVRELFPCMVH